VNILSINLAALVTLWYMGYRPHRWFRADEARTATVKRIGVLAVSILVLSAFLGGVTLDSYQQAETTTDIEDGAERVVSDSGGIHLSTDVEFVNTPVFQQPQRVVVRVGIEPGQEPLRLGSRLDALFDHITGQDVTTQVRYVIIEGGVIGIAVHDPGSSQRGQATLLRTRSILTQYGSAGPASRDDVGGQPRRSRTGSPAGGHQPERSIDECLATALRPSTATGWVLDSILGNPADRRDSVRSTVPLHLARSRNDRCVVSASFATNWTHLVQCYSSNGRGTTRKSIVRAPG